MFVKLWISVFLLLLTGLSLFLFCTICLKARVHTGYVLARKGSLGIFLAFLRQWELKSSSRERKGSRFSRWRWWPPQCSWHNKHIPVHTLYGAVVTGYEQFLFDMLLPNPEVLWGKSLCCTFFLLLNVCAEADGRGGIGGPILTLWEGFWQEVWDPAADGWSQAQLCQFGDQSVGGGGTALKVYNNQLL